MWDVMYWVVLMLFLVSILYNIIVVGQASGSSDAKNDMIKAITNVTIVNSILMLVMAGAAYFYFKSADGAPSKDSYILFMVHVTLLISVISVSISSLRQLNSS